MGAAREETRDFAQEFRDSTGLSRCVQPRTAMVRRVCVEMSPLRQWRNFPPEFLRSLAMTSSRSGRWEIEISNDDVWTLCRGDRRDASPAPNERYPPRSEASREFANADHPLHEINRSLGVQAVRALLGWN